METMTPKYDPTLRVSKRVGGWLLEWEPHRPATVWVIPEYLKQWKRSSSGIYYGEDSNPRMAWDLPIPPAYVRTAALTFIQGIITCDSCGVSITEDDHLCEKCFETLPMDTWTTVGGEQ